MARKSALDITSMSPGKLLGMQRIANTNGTLTMLALDQNSSIIKMAKGALARVGEAREPTYKEIVTAKVDLASRLGRKAGAVLLDSVYGAWQAICAFKFPPRTGLIVRLERTGSDPTADGNGKLTRIEEGWSVGKIKRMGADAVKLLVYYEPTHTESAHHQRQLVEQVARECDEHDIVFLLETLSYPFADEQKTSPSYLDRKPTTAIDTAVHLSALCDVYKAEFPGTLGHDADERLAANLDALDEACKKPWVLLSAGVDFPDYERQVAMAAAHGASGVLGGRAFWKEYFDFDDRKERVNFLRTEAVQRLSTVDRIVRKNAKPWFKKYRITKGRFARVKIPEGWHRDYKGEAAPATEGQAPTGPLDTSGDY
ncbi:MAG: tagatose 1,6-diphosphate aldolase [Candidatus Brocadiia bacterium]